MREDPAMASWLSSLSREDRVAICTITRGEILFGLERLAPGQRRSELTGKAEKLFASVLCEPVPIAAADSYAQVKSGQQRLGLPLDENDLWIAATTLALGAALVTRDSDFEAIPGLVLVKR
jgi:predicted nucleic acid-binding protein